MRAPASGSLSSLSTAAAAAASGLTTPATASAVRGVAGSSSPAWPAAAAAAPATFPAAPLLQLLQLRQVGQRTTTTAAAAATSCVAPTAGVAAAAAAPSVATAWSHVVPGTCAGRGAAQPLPQGPAMAAAEVVGAVGGGIDGGVGAAKAAASEGSGTCSCSGGGGGGVSPWRSPGAMWVGAPAASRNPWSLEPSTHLPYGYGTEGRRSCSGGGGGGRPGGLLWVLSTGRRRAGTRAATAAPPLCLTTPLAVRQLHGGAVSGGEDGRRPAAGESSEEAGGAAAGSPPHPSTSLPREEGLGAPMDVFDRHLKALHRDRSSALLDASDPLLAAVTERLLDRLEDCRRSFPTAVVLGGAALPVLRQLAGIERVAVVDSSQAMLDRVKREEAEEDAAAARAAASSDPPRGPRPRLLCVRGDEEHLPLRPQSVDLIISCLGLHWVNDLPGALAQCRMALRPDGLFLGAVLGGETLQELRISCALAQMEREGGVSAVVSPLAQVRDAGNLLTRADLRLPAVDVDRFHIGYPSPLELVQHLRALGESNAARRRRRSLSRDSALAAAAVYQTMFGSRREGEGEGEDASISATFEVIFMTGWAPSAGQPKAAKRGSATLSFQELADGLVQGGAAVVGTAADGVVAPPSPPPPPPPPPGAAAASAAGAAPGDAAQRQAQ